MKTSVFRRENGTVPFGRYGAWKADLFLQEFATATTVSPTSGPRRAKLAGSGTWATTGGLKLPNWLPAAETGHRLAAGSQQFEVAAIKAERQIARLGRGPNDRRGEHRLGTCVRHNWPLWREVGKGEEGRIRAQVLVLHRPETERRRHAEARVEDVRSCAVQRPVRVGRAEKVEVGARRPLSEVNARPTL